MAMATASPHVQPCVLHQSSKLQLETRTQLTAWAAVHKATDALFFTSPITESSKVLQWPILTVISPLRIERHC